MDNSVSIFLKLGVALVLYASVWLGEKLYYWSFPEIKEGKKYFRFFFNLFFWLAVVYGAYVLSMSWLLFIYLGLVLGGIFYLRAKGKMFGSNIGSFLINAGFGLFACFEYDAGAFLLLFFFGLLSGTYLKWKLRKGFNAYYLCSLGLFLGSFIYMAYAFLK